MIEYFDLVDSNDQVVGRTTKVVAHKRGQMHRVVAVYVFDSKGRLLVQKRLDDGRMDHSVGGHVRKGESYLRAARREMKEELELDLPVVRIGTVFSDETRFGKNIKHFFGVYMSILPNGWEFKPTEEVKEISFWDLDKVKEAMRRNEMDFSGGFINIFLRHNDDFLKQLSVV